MKFPLTISFSDARIDERNKEKLRHLPIGFYEISIISDKREKLSRQPQQYVASIASLSAQGHKNGKLIINKV